MCKTRNLIICILTLILCTPNLAFAKNTREYTYNYGYSAESIEDIAFFELYKTISPNTIEDVKISSMDDVMISDNKIYIIDSIESRLNIFSEDLELITSIKLVNTKDGKIAIDKETNSQIMLKNPEGVFVHEQENEIYIADTGNSRIVIIDKDEYYFKRVINAPKNMVGQTAFKPSKIVVDKINRIYTVIQSGFEGIVELTSDGEFSRYFGVNTPKVNLIDYFWRQQASDEQKSKMSKVLAPSFNNISIDNEGFIYATTQDTTSYSSTFRFNPKGENVLRAPEKWQVVGDYIDDKGEFVGDKRFSKFVDIALTDYGVYATLDRERGHIFIYNFDGQLMNIIGGKGFTKGELLEPTSIDWLGNNLIVTDKGAKSANIYKPTKFGELALLSQEAYFKGEWDKSTDFLMQAIEINANYGIAYSLIGKSYLMKEDFEEAMYYFKIADDREYYSKAFSGYRNIWIKEHFGIIFTVLIIGIVWVIVSERRYFKNKKA